jgi:hypothetical protein
MKERPSFDCPFLLLLRLQSRDRGGVPFDAFTF